MLPVPELAKLILPGLALANTANSRSERARTEGCTAMAKRSAAISPTGTRSRETSKLRLGMDSGVIVKDAEPVR